LPGHQQWAATNPKKQEEVEKEEEEAEEAEEAEKEEEEAEKEEAEKEEPEKEEAEKEEAEKEELEVEKEVEKPAKKEASKKEEEPEAEKEEEEKPEKAGGGGEAKDIEIEVETDVKEAPAQPEVPLDPQSALKDVLRRSLFHDGLARGLHEAVKALDRETAHLCVLSGSCNEPAYTKLITALCKEHKIPMIKVEDSKTLGEWAGLCRRNSEGKPVKVVGCSCVVVKSWGEESPARTFIQEHIAKRKD